ncbi:CASP-like protein 5C1 [Hibiscus syriacus]|uniref:CASP-like protein n=1 Tax=Hibiscus syriacus TaxID=106335 RepID=A0A6A3C9Q8_HIBSY|nr:CASP-like protein 5C1 [Hibiscus syriacus]
MMRQNFQIPKKIGCKMAMDVVPGSLGTSVGCSLRLGQTLFSCAFLLFMSLGVEFYSNTALCYLVVTIMGLVIPWSLTLAMVDGYYILVKCPVRQPGVLVIIAAGDWVLSVLTLAAECSTASVVGLLFHSDSSSQSLVTTLLVIL